MVQQLELPLEKSYAKHPAQQLLRPKWRADLAHYCLDWLFGSHKIPPRAWPDEYGVFGETLPDDIIGQHLHSFWRAE